MAVRIQIRRGTAAQWTAANPALALGEQGYETDTGRMKVGNGTDQWALLEYYDEHVGDALIADGAFVNEVASSQVVVDAAVAAIDAEPRIADLNASTLGMPTVVTTNYTRHLSRYSSMAAAIADLPNAGANGGEIHVDGDVTWTGTANIPANVHLIGRGKGATVLQMPASPTVPMLQLNNAHGAMIADMAILLPEGTNAAAGAYAIHIQGATNGVLLERLFLDRTSRGVNAEGWAGTTPGLITNLTLRDVTANRSPSTFGFNFDDVDGVTLDNCVAEYNNLDGAKLRKKASNVLFLGGRYNNNGVGPTGDGIDIYAGGDTVTLIGTEMAYNSSSGITVKTGALNRDDPNGYGYVRNLMMTDVRCIGNLTGGAYVTVSTQTDFTEPLVDTVEINGGLFLNNGAGTAGDGLYINARNVAVNGSTSKGNKRHGYLVASRTIDLRMTGAQAIANSQGGAGSFDGFNLTGHNGRLVNCRAIGVNGDAVTQESSYSALTKYHSYGFRVASTATGKWSLNDCDSTYHVASGNGIRTDMTSGICLIDQETTANPGAVAVFGSIGSRARNTSATVAADVLWVKTSGAPNASTTGWSRVNVT